LRALLGGALDYAGLFPPARLLLDQAVRNCLRYRHEPESWLLGRFVLPVARLGELAPFSGELPTSGPPFVVSALARGGKTVPEFLAGLDADLRDSAAFLERHAPAFAVDVLEARLPPDAVTPDGQRPLAELLDAAGRRIEETGPPQLTVYYEAPPESLPGPGVGAVIEAVARHNAAGPGRRYRGAGLKLRCGGLEAAAFPAPEQVAFALHAGLAAGVPLKFTAGLHHPVRRFDAGVQAHMHGFLNVFGAGALGHAHGLNEEELCAILADEDAGHFACDGAGLRWRDLRATPEQVARARREAVISFGSCSFDEPRDDLRALGWLGD
ncbi:MAG TPA: hypothetical protein VFE78_31840, partial [Gemmataceae bacterium]|nr:hypothetical protein [Gemmataceae bacterium]